MKERYCTDRLSKLRKRMEEAQLPGLFVQNPANVTYLSGFTGEDSYLLLTAEAAGGKNYFLTDNRYTEQAKEECPAYECVLYRETDGSLPTAVARLCRSNGLNRLGFSGEHMSFGLYTSLSQACAGLELTAAPPLVERLRMVKDPGEIALLRQACLCTDRAFSEICKFIRAGRTEKEVEWQLLCLFHELGCGSSFPIIAVSGVNGAKCHGGATHKKLETGDFLTLDFGCLYAGYHADMTRTVHIGPADQRAKQIYGIVLEANRRAEALVKAGVPASAIDAAARDYITEQGFGPNFGHSVGHGVGLDIHELPGVNARNPEPLPAGAFITVEPGIYISGWGGVRIEDTLLVTETGAENQFTSTKELLCL